MGVLLKLDGWSLTLFFGICFFILFFTIYHFKPLTNAIAENFREVNTSQNSKKTRTDIINKHYNRPNKISQPEKRN